MKTLKWFLLGAVLLIIASLHVWSLYSTSIMLGTWESRQENNKGTMDRVITYFPLGRYEEKSTVNIVGGSYPYWVTGDWSLKGDKLSHVVTSSDSPPYSPEVGSEVNVELVFLNNDTVELHYPSGKIFKAFRKKSDAIK